MMRLFLASGLALLMALPGTALADKKDKGKKKDKDKDDVNVSIDVHFSIEQRHAVQEYVVTKHGRGKCPPGLAKKNNGCLPPGQAKKRYAVGRPLPPDFVIIDLPDEIAIRVGPPPRGYRYGVIDGDVVKLVVGTLLVVDAIQGLVE
jgi:hypothetical protein